jgi:hypothetical protein
MARRTAAIAIAKILSPSFWKSEGLRARSVLPLGALDVLATIWFADVSQLDVSLLSLDLLQTFPSILPYPD